ncbi:hypothetical protein E5D57_007695 [Metarhizium anisopliae]|nr:hypothetical protein E5D57_007695 [Metarhizium anisopliae]
MLIEALQSFSGLEQKTIDYLAWAKKRLHNQFLSQTEPPERFVNVEPMTERKPAPDEEEIDNEDDNADKDESDDVVAEADGNEADLSGDLVGLDFI